MLLTEADTVGQSNTAKVHSVRYGLSERISGRKGLGHTQ